MASGVTDGLDSSFIDIISLLLCSWFSMPTREAELDDDVADVIDELENERVGVRATGSWQFSSRLNRLNSI